MRRYSVSQLDCGHLFVAIDDVNNVARGDGYPTAEQQGVNPGAER